MTSSRVRFVVRFTGQVQGVGFRATTVSVGRDLEVDGDVRNEPAGSVRLDVEGPRQSLNELLDRIQTAMGSRIDDRQIDERPVQNRTGGLRISV